MPISLHPLGRGLASWTLRGRPNLVPLARNDALWRAVRSPGAVRARQAGVISKHPGPARAGPPPSEQPRSNSPISQCHRRVRVLVDLTPDELSDLGGSI
jgi:hypothetical protein